MFAIERTWNEPIFTDDRKIPPSDDEGIFTQEYSQPVDFSFSTNKETEESTRY